MNQKTSKVEKEFYLRCSYLTLSVLFDKEPRKDGKKPFFLLVSSCLVFLLVIRFSTLHHTSFTCHYRPATFLMFLPAQ